MRCGPALLVFLLAMAWCHSANANLVIDPTFDSSIMTSSSATAIEAGIEAAISRLEGAIATAITVNIDFVDDTSIGLGESDTYMGDLPYSTYLSDLKNNQTLSTLDKEAIASLPSQSINPVNRDTEVSLTLPLLRAIGEASLGSNDGITGDPDDFDGTISLNIPDMNLSRTGPQDSLNYDLQAVVGHEMDEVLGIGGAGSELSSSGTLGPVGPMDLFRYSGVGTRSYNASGNIKSYFSINSGTTNLVYFNQNSGGDYGDWGNGVTPAEMDGNTPPQVQDAFGDPGVDVNVGTNELIALDVVGYDLTAPVPEPRDIWFVGGGLVAIVVYRRGGRRNDLTAENAKNTKSWGESREHG